MVEVVVLVEAVVLTEVVVLVEAVVLVEQVSWFGIIKFSSVGLYAWASVQEENTIFTKTENLNLLKRHR